MTNILNEQCTNQEYADFVNLANQNGQTIEIQGNKVYRLYPYEIIENEEIVNISETPEYQKAQRLMQIEEELLRIETNFEESLDTSVEYVNGHLYKLKWAEGTYLSLLSAGQIIPALFPQKIWDATELEENAVIMTIEDLIQLTGFLAQLQQKLFDERKKAKAELLKEKSLLENSCTSG